MGGMRWLAGLAGGALAFSLIGCAGNGGGHAPTATPSPTSTATFSATSSATPTSTPAATSTATSTPAATATATATPVATASATVTPSATPTATATPEVTCAVGPVQTTIGAVCGTVAATAGTSVDAFLGIPFGEDTGGANRWEPPVPKARLTGTFQATALGPICEQAPPQYAAPPLSEDCLSINIWTPADARPSAGLPVMAFVYGGAFVTGASAVPLYDGAYLSASQHVVVVNFNYRLGALGFLAGVEGLNGNYGLLDQQLALQWVADNIAAFGGDPNQVLLFGESAGAMSVGLHLLSVPSSSGLFSAALMESNPLALPYKTVAQAAPFGASLEKLLGCQTGGLACMRSKPAADIVTAQGDKSLVLEGLLSGFSGLLLWAPVVDGTLVTGQPTTAAAAGLPKPTLLGTNQDEGTLFVYDALQELGLSTLTAAQYEDLLTQLFGATDAAAILQAYPATDMDNAPQLAEVANDYIFFCSTRYVANAGGSPVYAYLFTQPSHFNIWPSVPQCAAPTVCHGAELPYVFHTAANIGETFLPAEDVVSQAMLGYWSGFSRPGHDPNTGGASRPAWPMFPGFDYLMLATPITAVTDPPHHCQLWDQIGYATVSVTGTLQGGAP